jgi:hypothetical protein
MLSNRRMTIRFVCRVRFLSAAPASAPFDRGLAALCEMSERPVIRTFSKRRASGSRKNRRYPSNSIRCGRFCVGPQVPDDVSLSRNHNEMRLIRSGKLGRASLQVGRPRYGDVENFCSPKQINFEITGFPIDHQFSDELSKNRSDRNHRRTKQKGCGADGADPAQRDATGSLSSRNAPASGRWCSRHRCCRHRRHRHPPMLRGTWTPR